MSAIRRTYSKGLQNTIEAALNQPRQEPHGNLFTMKPSYLEKKRSDANEKSKHTKRDATFNPF